MRSTRAVDAVKREQQPQGMPEATGYHAHVYFGANTMQFGSLAQAAADLESWRIDYNPASQHPFIYVVEEKRFC